jgi:hypothetical protein
MKLSKLERRSQKSSNEIADTKLILSIDVESGSPKPAFNIVKCCMPKMIKMSMQLALGRGSRTNVSLLLFLPR